MHILHFIPDMSVFKCFIKNTVLRCLGFLKFAPVVNCHTCSCHAGAYLFHGAHTVYFLALSQNTIKSYK